MSVVHCNPPHLGFMTAARLDHRVDIDLHASIRATSFAAYGFLTIDLFGFSTALSSICEIRKKIRVTGSKQDDQGRTSEARRLHL